MSSFRSETFFSPCDKVFAVNVACTSCFWHQGILATKIYLIRYRLFFVNQSKNKQALHVHVKLCEKLHVLKTLFNSVARISSKFTSKALSNSFKIRSLKNSRQQGQRLHSDCVKRKTLAQT